MIGIFDSGIGGITVLERCIEQMPQESFMFYGDFDHVPYGTKNQDEICQYVDNAVQFLRNQGADIVVLACNTATSAAAAYLREKYDFPILGMEPAIKLAYDHFDSHDHHTITVTATDLTLKLEKLDDLINRLGIRDYIEEVSLQKLVIFAESGDFGSEDVVQYIHNQFSKCDFNSSCAIVLGCTHFTFYKTLINDIVLGLAGRNIPIIDGNIGTVNYLSTFVDQSNNDVKLNPELRFYESGRLVSNEKYMPLLKIAHKQNQGG